MNPVNYLLDTNAISEAVKSRKNIGYMSWLDGAIDAQLYVSCLTIGEIQKGVQMVKDPNRRTRLEAYLAGLYDAFSGRILDVTTKDTVLWGKLVADAQKVGKVAPIIDSLIAAQCMQHQMVLVTRNVKDFEQYSGLDILSPWSKE